MPGVITTMGARETPADRQQLTAPRIGCAASASRRTPCAARATSSAQTGSASDSSGGGADVIPVIPPVPFRHDTGAVPDVPRRALGRSELRHVRRWSAGGTLVHRPGRARALERVIERSHHTRLGWEPTRPDTRLHRPTQALGGPYSADERVSTDPLAALGAAFGLITHLVHPPHAVRGQALSQRRRNGRTGVSKEAGGCLG